MVFHCMDILVLQLEKAPDAGCSAIINSSKMNTPLHAPLLIFWLFQVSIVKLYAIQCRDQKCLIQRRVARKSDVLLSQSHVWALAAEDPPVCPSKALSMLPGLVALLLDTQSFGLSLCPPWNVITSGRKHLLKVHFDARISLYIVSYDSF